MAIQPGVWGIDLGQCALKALRLENVGDQVTATAFDYVEHPKILSQPDADPDQLIREALDKFLSRNTLRGDIVAISVPGQSGLARFVKLPPVEEKKIVDIVRFEAKQQIPFNLDEVVWDYQKIGAGTVTDGFAMDTEIGLFAIKRDIINNALQHFKDVNVEVHIVQMAPLALCNFVSYELLKADAEGAEASKKPAIVALDIGADSSNLVITDGKRIIWQRHIPLGGNHFTRALTKDLKLTFAKAEHLKRNATKSVDNIDLKKILASLKPVLNDFVGEVQRSLGYFMNTHRDAQIEYMIGLGSAFRLPGLQRFLGEKLQLEVRKLAKLEKLTGDSVLTQPAFADNIVSFSVAYGLALQGLKLARLQTNLLPPEIQMDRLVRAKKPFAAAAAAALLLGVGGLALGYSMDYRSYGAPAVLTAIEGANGQKPDSVVSVAKKSKTEFEDEKKKADEEERAVKSIIAGSEERLDWIKLNKFINDSLPRHDGTNLSWNRNFLFWDRARESYEKWKQRQAGAKVGEKAEVGDGIEDLIQVNIEAVDCRYSDDLTAFWNAVKARPEFNTNIAPTIRPRPEKEGEVPAPEGKGWVVELRGYTYHQGKTNFVIQALLDNLAHNGITRPPTPAAAPAAPGAPSPAAPETPPKSDNPIENNISHLLVFRAESGTTTSFISTSVLPSLVVAGASTAGGGEGGLGSSPPAAGKGGGGMMMPAGDAGGGMGMGGGGAGGRGGWTPLGSGATSGGGQGGLMGGGPGSMAPAISMSPRNAVGSGDNVPPPTGEVGGTATETASKAQHTRTEFIILFVWKEPTPSDELMKLAEEAGTSTGGENATGGTAPQGGMSGSMPASPVPPSMNKP